MIATNDECFAMLGRIEASEAVVVELFGWARRFGGVKDVACDDEQVHRILLDFI
jgi:hypothetical protein